ncbi:MAG: hypothetical protein JNM56_24325 [Planctomycetia bacterium]|nr:hypothetical protein [Planctomycetia bacterium]
MSILFAVDWKEQSQQVLDRIQDFNDQRVPELLGRLRLPVFDELPMMNLAGDFAIVLAGIALLVALWRLLTLRIFRAFFAVVAALLIAYYPAAYGFHWWLFERDREARAEREVVPHWETKLRDNIRVVDWGILGVGVFLGGTLLLLSRPSNRPPEEEYDPQPPQQAANASPPWQTAPEPARRSSSRRSRPEKNPFDFS